MIHKTCEHIHDTISVTWGKHLVIFTIFTSSSSLLLNVPHENEREHEPFSFNKLCSRCAIETLGTGSRIACMDTSSRILIFVHESLLLKVEEWFPLE